MNQNPSESHELPVPYMMESAGEWDPASSGPTDTMGSSVQGEGEPVPDMMGSAGQWDPASTGPINTMGSGEGA